jgi:hypothetical protein
MNRFKIVLGRLLLIITITITTIPILVNEESIIMAQDQDQEQGVTPIDPENVTNQTLQGYPTEDKNMSTGIENK